MHHGRQSPAITWVNYFFEAFDEAFLVPDAAPAELPRDPVTGRAEVTFDPEASNLPTFFAVTFPPKVDARAINETNFLTRLAGARRAFQSFGRVNADLFFTHPSMAAVTRRMADKAERRLLLRERESMAVLMEKAPVTSDPSKWRRRKPSLAINFFP